MEVIVSKPSNIQLPVHVQVILYKQLPVFATQFNKRTPALFIKNLEFFSKSMQ